jgi:hypothetical protein
MPNTAVGERRSLILAEYIVPEQSIAESQIGIVQIRVQHFLVKATA